VIAYSIYDEGHLIRGVHKEDGNGIVTRSSTWATYDEALAAVTRVFDKRAWGSWAPRRRFIVEETVPNGTVLSNINTNRPEYTR
jgi:hypothetical protein